MSTFDDDFEASAWPDLKGEFGESVTHRPLGNPANDEPITAVFTERAGSLQTDRGRGTRRSGEVRVDDTVSVTEESKFVIGSTVWDVEAKPPDPVGGHIVAQVVRYDEEFRRPGRAI